MTNKQSFIIKIGNENIFFSALRDLKTFGFLVGSFYLNHTYIGGNNFLDTLLCVMSILFFFAKTIDKRGGFSDIKIRKFGTAKDAIKYLEGEIEDDK